MSSGVEVAERLQAIRQRAKHVLAWGGTPKIVGSWFAEARAFAREVMWLLERLEAAERQIDSGGGRLSASAVEDAKREVAYALGHIEDRFAAVRSRSLVAFKGISYALIEAEARVAVLEQERDEARRLLVDVAAGGSEAARIIGNQLQARIVALREALQRVEWIWDEDANANRCPSCGLLEGRGLYFGGHDRSCSLGAALAVDGTPDSQTDTGDDAERRPSGGET